MTNEEAARILDPATSEEALRPYALDCVMRMAVVEEASRLGAAALRERQRWIPVTERLPAADGVYIVHCDDSFEPMDERIWGDSVVAVADWRFGGWSWDNNGIDYDLDGIVTHWMHLPEAPEVE